MAKRSKFRKVSMQQLWELMRKDFPELSKKSTCKKVLGRPAPCYSRPEVVARHVMCRAFYMPTNLSGDEFLVEHFRKNVRGSWAEYRRQCPINDKKKLR